MTELVVAIADYIEHFNYCIRPHSSLCRFTPEESENLQLAETQAALA